MSDWRVPDQTISVNARLDGKKAVKIELFKAGSWQRSWKTDFANEYQPRVPAAKTTREEYFNSRYRVRLNGKWYQDGGRFTMLTYDEILDRFLRGRHMENCQNDQ